MLTFVCYLFSLIIIFLILGMTSDLWLYLRHFGCHVEKCGILFNLHLCRQSPYWGILCRSKRGGCSAPQWTLIIPHLPKQNANLYQLVLACCHQVGAEVHLPAGSHWPYHVWNTGVPANTTIHCLIPPLFIRWRHKFCSPLEVADTTWRECLRFLVWLK